MFLAGTYELTIDPKNRLSIPLAIRKKLNDARESQYFYLRPGRRRGTLALYPDRYYEALREQAPDDDLLSDDAYEYRQFEFSQSAPLEMDDQWRVLIPARVIQRAGLGRDVVMIGVRDHLEIWRKDEFEAFEQRMWAEHQERRTRAIAEMHALAAAGGATRPAPAAGAQAGPGASGGAPAA